MLRIGSIGAGNRGRLCQLAHQPKEGSELVAICDLRSEICEEYRQNLHSDVKFYTDYQQMLAQEKLDGVFITTPDYLHETMAVAALRQGIGVYLEKPLAITIEGCDHIIKTAAQYGAKLYVGHNMRFFPVIQKMKQWIDEGRIGEVQAIWCRHFVDYGGDAYFKDWHSERQYSMGLLLQKGAHDIDVIHYLAGSYTARTVGMGKLSVYNRVTDRRQQDEHNQVEFNQAHWPPLSQTKLSPNIDVEDHSMMLMQLANGVQASYCQCHYTPDGWRNYTIIGTEGRIENSGDSSNSENWASVQLWDRRCCAGCRQGNFTEAVPPLKGSHAGADPQIVNAFLNYLRTGTCHGATPIDARMAVAAGYMATMSMRNGNSPMDIPALHIG